MDSTSTNKPEIRNCYCCLAIDRKLTRLGNYENLYKRLTAAWSSPDCRLTENLVEYAELLICWECESTFRKINKFRQKILMAQDVLRGKVNIKLENGFLSELTTSVKTYYDLKIIHEESTVNMTFIETNDTEHLKLENLELADTPDAKNIHKDTLIKAEIKHESSESEYEPPENCDFTTDNDGWNKTVPSNKPEKSATKKRRTHKTNYKVILTQKCSEDEQQKFYVKHTINQTELSCWLEKERNLKNFKNSKYKCTECISGFDTDKEHTDHKEKAHLANYQFKCDMCGIMLPTKSQMSRHCREHMNTYKCVMCGYSCLKKERILYHIHHLHEKLYECLKCKMLFDASEIRYFHRHYRELHKKCTCDHCGQSFSQKTLLSKHILKKHTSLFCEICNKYFKRYKSLKAHNEYKHTKKESEETFCVECNMQFMNIKQYSRHLKTSVKHIPKHKQRFSCPLCYKVYSKKTYMNNHYNLVHLQQTKFFCDQCSKYFLNGCQLRRHTIRFHDKKKPQKNKLCSYCGRGFSERRTLEHHIRTHTGERPFQCSHCPAAFAQKTPLVVHSKAIHKVTIKASEIHKNI